MAQKPATEDFLRQLREFCEELLAARDGADINAASPAGDTPLHYAMNRADLSDDFIRWLIAKGADPLRKNESSFTPLDVADPGRSPALERDFLYPKIQRKDALAFLNRTPERYAQEVRYYGAEPGQKSPLNLASLLWQTIGTPRPDPQAKQFTEMQFNYPFEALVFRPNEKGEFVQAGKARIDLDAPPKPETWPTLQPGDVVSYFRPGPVISLTTSQAMRDWLENEATKKLLPPAPDSKQKPTSAPASHEPAH